MTPRTTAKQISEEQRASVVRREPEKELLRLSPEELHPRRVAEFAAAQVPRWPGHSRWKAQIAFALHPFCERLRAAPEAPEEMRAQAREELSEAIRRGVEAGGRQRERFQVAESEYARADVPLEETRVEAFREQGFDPYEARALNLAAAHARAAARLASGLVEDAVAVPDEALLGKASLVEALQHRFQKLHPNVPERIGGIAVRTLLSHATLVECGGEPDWEGTWAAIEPAALEAHRQLSRKSAARRNTGALFAARRAGISPIRSLADLTRYAAVLLAGG